MKTLKEALKDAKIGYFCNFLNEKEALENHVKKMAELDFDARIYIDGRFPNFPSKETGSTDGSLDIIKKLPKTHIIKGGIISEIDKNNLAFKTAGNIGLDFLIQCDADEWIDFDRKVLLESFEQEAESVNTFQFMVRFTNHWSSPPRIVNKLPRLFWQPQFISCSKIHWWFYAFNTRLVVDPYIFVEGAHIHHDDRLRTLQRNDLMDKYQEGNIRREQAIINKEIDHYKVKIEDHKCFVDTRLNDARCVICKKVTK